MYMCLSDRDNLNGVEFFVPLYLLRHRLQMPVGKYLVGDGMDGECARVCAAFFYYYAAGDTSYRYISYDGGTLIITKTGQYVSGSYSFGALTDEGRQVNVDGSFENMPFSPVNLP